MNKNFEKYIVRVKTNEVKNIWDLMKIDAVMPHWMFHTQAETFNQFLTSPNNMIRTLIFNMFEMFQIIHLDAWLLYSYINYIFHDCQIFLLSFVGTGPYLMGTCVFSPMLLFASDHQVFIFCYTHYIFSNWYICRLQC